MPNTWAYLLRLPAGSGYLELKNADQVVSKEGKKYFSVCRSMFGNTEIRDLCGLCRVNGEDFNPVTVLKHGYKISIPKLEKEYVFVDCSVSNAVLNPFGLAENYAIAQLLGEGGFGEVYLCFEKKNSSPLALKISKGPGSKREIDILRSLNHPHVITTYANRCVGNGGNITFIIMEYMAGGDLACFVNNTKVHLTEKQVKLLFYQVVQGVHYLHDRRICHRDLKPANILLSRSHPNTLVKVTDLGIAKSELMHSPMDTQIGTRGFMAPELLQPNYTNAVDVWSLGVILHLSLTASFPTVSGSKVTIKKMSSSQKCLEDLITKMLQFYPENRATIEDVKTSPWLKDESVENEIKEILKREKKCEENKQINFEKPARSEKLKQEDNKLKRNLTIVVVIGGIVLLAALLIFRR